MSFEPPNYDVLDRALAVNDADVGPSEAHGLLTGLLCAAGEIPLAVWGAQVFAEVSEGAGAGGLQPWDREQECGPLMDGLYQSTLHGLFDEALSFDLLLPDDDRELAIRIEELAVWAQGFMAGLGLAGECDWDTLSDECNEAMHDVAQVGQIEAEGDSEEDEQAYTEVVEYLRMAILLIHAEFQALPVPSSVPDSDQLH